MGIIVQKYGGTSVGSVERIANVARRVIAYREQGHDMVVVVSAMSGETDRLMRLAKEIDPHPNERELDVLLSTGEQDDRLAGDDVAKIRLSSALVHRGSSPDSH